MVKPLEFYKKHKAIISVLLIGIFVRLIVLLLLNPWDAQRVQQVALNPSNDSVMYHNEALKILKSISLENLNTLLTPIFPLFIAINYYIFGQQQLPIVLLQILLSLITGLMVYKMAFELLNKQIAFVTAILFYIDTLVIVQSLELLADTLFLIFFIGSVLVLILGLRRNNAIYFFYSGILLGVTTLTKPIAILFPFVCIIILFSYAYLKFRYKILYSLVFLFIFFLTLAPWSLRNYAKFGYLELTSLPGYNLYNNNAVYVMIAKTGLTRKDVIANFNTQLKLSGINKENNPFEVSATQKKIALDVIKKNLFVYTKIHLRGVLFMFMGTNSAMIAESLGFKGNITHDYNSKKSSLEIIKANFAEKSVFELCIAILVNVYQLIIYALFFWGCYLLKKDREYFILAFTILILLYFSMITGAVGNVRYRLPMVAFYLMISAKGIVSIINSTNIKLKASRLLRKI